MWAGSFRKDQMLIMLESGGRETGLFKSTTRHMNRNEFYEMPVFHVWIDGKWVLATENYWEACDTYDRYRTRKKDTVKPIRH